jgi:LPPG:FO 2-phospho-L-lactate transferase
MKVVELSGGVGGARMARGLAALDDVDLTVIVNVGDDEVVHGLHVSPDIDTVLYTLAGVEGPEGWGRRGDTFTANTELGRLGADNRFRLGDLDLALNLHRTAGMRAGAPLSVVTTGIAAAFGCEPRILPVTDDPLRTEVELDSGWTSFQDYFVIRGNRDEVRSVRFAGAETATPAPGVLEEIASADIVVVAPSNPPLSIWPMLAVGGVRNAVEAHRRVIAVSPLIGGHALKGPADRVMSSLGLSSGSRGVVEAYRGLIQTLVVDVTDAEEVGRLDGVEVVATDTRIPDLAASTRLAKELVAP